MRTWIRHLLLAVLAGCTHTLTIPTPTLPPGTPLPESPPSTIDIPVEADLSSARTVLENEVPRDINAMGAWTMVADDRIGIKYHATRSDFSLGLHGATLDAGVRVEYEAEGCVRQKKPWPLSGYVCPKVASCGQGEPKRLVDASARSSFAWSEDWHLDSHTTTSLSYPNRCQVTFLNYDVTPHINNVIKPRLDSAAQQLDQRIAALTNIRERAQVVWDALWKPIEVAPDTWLLVRPSTFRVAPFNGQGMTVSTTVGVDARPILQVGSAPAQPTVPALPKLMVAPPGSSFFVAVRAEVTYAAATAELKALLGGKKIDVSGHTVEIRSVEVRGVNNVAVLVLDVVTKTGWLRNTKGKIYVTGIPQYDPLTTTVSLSSVDYSLETRRALESIDWLLHGRFLAIVQEKARWQLGDKLEVAKQRLSAALDRTIGKVVLHGQIAEVRPIGVLTTTDRFAVYGEARGSVRATVNP